MATSCGIIVSKIIAKCMNNSFLKLLLWLF